MGQNVTNKYPASPIVDLDDEAISVPFDIEDCILPDRIRMGIGLAHVRKTLPLCLFSDAVPDIQWLFQILMFLTRRFQRSPRKDMHLWTSR